jgi:hypothetical protein
MIQAPTAQLRKLVERKARHRNLVSPHTARRSSHSHSDGGRQGKNYRGERNDAEKSICPAAHWEVHIFLRVFTQLRPLPCVPRRLQSGASPARTHSGGSRTAQEWDRDILGSYTHRPFRLSSSPPFSRCPSARHYLSLRGSLGGLCQAYDFRCRRLTKQQTVQAGKTWNSRLFGVTSDDPSCQ